MHMYRYKKNGFSVTRAVKVSNPGNRVAMEAMELFDSLCYKIIHNEYVNEYLFPVKVSRNLGEAHQGQKASRSALSQKAG